jgi:hypothetical protein
MLRDHHIYYINFQQNTPHALDVTDAVSLVGLLQNFQHPVTSALGDIVAKKSGIEGLLPGSVGADVVNRAMSSALGAMKTILAVRSTLSFTTKTLIHCHLRRVQ